jgi:hypothetical protein
MEVWFFYQEGTTAERQTHTAKNLKEFTPRSSEARQESFLPFDKDLSWKSCYRMCRRASLRSHGKLHLFRRTCGSKSCQKLNEVRKEKNSAQEVLAKATQIWEAIETLAEFMS